MRRASISPPTARNPAIGIRSFGADPGAVSVLAAAWTRGVRSAGVAVTAKHFPGLGAVTVDSHHHLPVLDLPRETLAARELAPFRASIEAGADLVMSAHIAMTAYSHDPTLPATLDPSVMTGLLRDELGFDGLTISDALDMRALPQGPEQAIDAVVAMRAGIDLLLLTPDTDAQARRQTGSPATTTPSVSGWPSSRLVERPTSLGRFDLARVEPATLQRAVRPMSTRAACG